MRHDRLLAKALVPMVLIGVAVACGGDDDQAQTEAVTQMPFDVATAGHAQGMVMFEGTPPPPEELDMTSEPECAAHWGDSPAVRDVVQVSNGHLANVFVYVKEGLDGMTFPRPQEPAVIDQVGCRYTPHVSGVMAGQPVVFRNSDPVMHNINATPAVNRPFNFSQPVVDMENERTFAQPEVMVPVRCDVHGWMRSYIGIVAHPYHGVTEDGGTFSLRDLPPGDYVVEAWHPVLGTQEQSITIETGQTAQLSFTFTEEMIGSAVVPLGDPIDPHVHHPILVGAAGNGHSAHVHTTAGSGRD